MLIESSKILSRTENKVLNNGQLGHLIFEREKLGLGFCVDVSARGSIDIVPRKLPSRDVYT